MSSSFKESDMNGAKILLFDIETAPNLGWVWGKWEQNVLDYVSSWYMLSFSAKWLGHKRVISSALPNFKRFSRNKEDDKEVVKALWKLLDEADIVIAHNGNSFDIKKANARFLFHKMKPPSGYRTIDTLLVARRHFSLNSNKLDDLAAYLGIGRKLAHTGFDMWKRCMAGDKKAWEMMVAYNTHDVELLEDVYLALRPWMDNHPNVNLVNHRLMACPICGSREIQKRGFSYTRVTTFQRYQCLECGGWSRGESVKDRALKIR